jgi:hypothetical protein
LRRRRADRDLAREELDVHPEGNRQHAENGGRGGEHHRPRALAAGLDDGLVGGDAFAAQAVIGVDQHDVVVHDHARIRDHADPGHDHPERLAHDEEPEHHPEGREQHGGEHEAHRGELVELRQQDREDEKDRGSERLEQKGRGLGAFLVLALEPEGHARPEIRRGELARDVLLHLRGRHALGDVGGDRGDPVAVDTVDVAHARRRHALHEIADGHMPHRRLQAQIVDLIEAAPLRREPHQDVDRLVAVHRPVFRGLEPIGDELDGAADRADAGVVFGRLGFVELDAPVDAGERLAVVEIANVAVAGEDRRDFLRRCRQHGRIDRTELHLDGLAGGRARARRRHLDENAGDVRRFRANGIHDLVRRRPAAPMRELELDHPDGIFGELAHAARLLADAGVDGLEPIELEHAALDLADETVLLLERKVAARMHDYLAVIGLHAGEELDSAAELAVGELHHDEKDRGERQGRSGMTQRKANRAHVGPAV